MATSEQAKRHQWQILTMARGHQCTTFRAQDFGKKKK